MAAPPPYPGTTDQKGGPPPPNPAYPQQPGPAGYGAQYGQPAQYNTPYGQNTSTVVVTQPAYTVVQHFRESPVRIKCQFCQADVVTSTYYETGTLTWVACFVIAIVGCWLGCCLIPFCMDACKDVVHQCPNCHQQVGRYNRM
ncbi:LITAF domain-containing protein-like isoform X6 [Mercenaria mercenaria]|uniref:LITAF domain-containing protein-like isoform X6 n=1 Tax=Mercenaria mercenaria TaxID=6596 RepID=UPI001E1DC21F|nr:LITAF domain-containing protein-like isoform X6 [Mercenaria mercenaria]